MMSYSLPLVGRARVGGPRHKVSQSDHTNFCVGTLDHDAIQPKRIMV